jgi:catechol 2,3-dioxygenase-like lactoylglutathione lyase family enzyme
MRSRCDAAPGTGHAGGMSAVSPVLVGRDAEAEFDAPFARIRSAGITFYAGPAHQRPGEVSHLRDGRRLYFEGPDGHAIEITTCPRGDRPS